MKVDSKFIIELINDVSWYAVGIKETCQMGGDVFENISQQADEIKKMLIKFQASYLTKEDRTTPVDKSYSYLKIMEKALRNKDIHNDPLSPEENVAIVQAKVYSFIKRTIRDNGIPEGLNSFDLRIYIENLLYNWQYFKTHEKNFLYSIYDVCVDITNEIIEFRKKNPQLKLF